MDKIKAFMYYILIGILSLISLVFLPMIGTEVGLAWNLPDTTIGWIVWAVTKIAVATINVLIFYCFMQQGKLNVKDDPKYIEARDILTKEKVKEVQPLSPAKWNLKQYGSKGTTIFISTCLSTVALTQAILTFDYITMLTYLFTIIMGIIFGILQMKNAEEYWTIEYWRYAQKVKNEREEAEKAREKQLQFINQKIEEDEEND